VKVLGVHSYSHDTSACLVENGKVTCAVEEERFVNIKHVRGLANGVNTPDNAIKWILAARGLGLGDIDIFAHSNEILHSSARRLNFTQQRFIEFADSLDPGLKKSRFYDHHLCHAASAFFPSNFETANILTVDGKGSSQATGVYHGTRDGITTIWEIPFSHSLGDLYKYVTRLLGFGRWGEGSMMALAAFGTPIAELHDLIQLTSYGYLVNSKTLTKLDEYRRTGNTPLQQSQRDLAATVQTQLELTLCHLANLAYHETRERCLCLAGGVALNCSANLKLLDLDCVDEIFVQPAAHDAGTAVGAALWAAYESGEAISNPMPHIYLGPEYQPAEIENTLHECGLAFSASPNIAKDAAELLMRGYVIGWFNGGLEFGPRALGNRSIFANPLKVGIHERVNVIKHRELWRPIAPAILEDDLADYFEPRLSSPFMTVALHAKASTVRDYSSILHLDNSARVQTVAALNNRPLYDLLTEFKTSSGSPMLINTSFNDAGMPIVRTPRDAIRTFFSTGLDYLILDSFVVSKR
jgi:carbamoyltransferase